MKNLSKLLTSEELKRRNETLSSIRKIETNDAKKLEWDLSQLLPATKKNYVFKNVSELKTYLVDRLEKQPIEELTITVEWKKSSMWGSNPTAESFVYGLGQLTSGSIGGCGYDKTSTAVAMVINQIPQFLQLMYELKNKKYKIKNRELFGYGSGYGILPSFEGGVGVDCYDRIFNAIGYEFKTVSSGKSFDVYRISKVSTKEQKRKATKRYNYAN